MSKEKKKVDNKRTVDPAAQEVTGANDGQIGAATTLCPDAAWCNFGRTGVCCRICLQGPCRITKKA